MKTDDPVLNEIIRRLVKTFEPERIYLFGSNRPLKKHSDRSLYPLWGRFWHPYDGQIR
jgi:hypothetical protein